MDLAAMIIVNVVSDLAKIYLTFFMQLGLCKDFLRQKIFLEDHTHIMREREREREREST
jgi:hypothetical protein